MSDEFMNGFSLLSWSFKYILPASFYTCNIRVCTRTKEEKKIEGDKKRKPMCWERERDNILLKINMLQVIKKIATNEKSCKLAACR